jgi:hypothetical protein
MPMRKKKKKKKKKEKKKTHTYARKPYNLIRTATATIPTPLETGTTSLVAGTIQQLLPSSD